MHLLPWDSELGVASSGKYSFLHSSQKFGFAEEQGGLADFGSCRGSVGGGRMLPAVLVLC